MTIYFFIIFAVVFIMEFIVVAREKSKADIVVYCVLSAMVFAVAIYYYITGNSFITTIFRALRIGE